MMGAVTLPKHLPHSHKSLTSWQQPWPGHLSHDIRKQALVNLAVTRLLRENIYTPEVGKDALTGLGTWFGNHPSGSKNWLPA